MALIKNRISCFGNAIVDVAKSFCQIYVLFGLHHETHIVQ